jgi:hypothetical protein
VLLTVSGAAADVKIQKQLTSMRIDQWLQEDLFHFRWWLLLAIFAVSAFIWWKLVDKKRLHEISLYAALTTIVTLGLDEYGEELALWDYPTDIMPIFPPLTAIDLASLPMVYSLIYQYFSTWKSFIWATVIMAAVFCFIFEPILTWGKFYQPLIWRYYFGFPIYIAMAICIRLVIKKIFALAEKYRKNN